MTSRFLRTSLSEFTALRSYKSLMSRGGVGKCGFITYRFQLIHFTLFLIHKISHGSMCRNTNIVQRGRHGDPLSLLPPMELVWGRQGSTRILSASAFLCKSCFSYHPAKQRKVRTFLSNKKYLFARFLLVELNHHSEQCFLRLA